MHWDNRAHSPTLVLTINVGSTVTFTPESRIRLVLLDVKESVQLTSLVFYRHVTQILHKMTYPYHVMTSTNLLLQKCVFSYKIRHLVNSVYHSAGAFMAP